MDLDKVIGDSDTSHRSGSHFTGPNHEFAQKVRDVKERGEQSLREKRN